MEGTGGLSLFDDATDGVVAFGDDDRYTYANQAALELFERQIVGEVVGRFAVAPIDDRMTKFKKAGSGSGEVAIRTGDDRVTVLQYRGITNYAPGIGLSLFRPVASHAPSRVERGGPRAALFLAVFEQLPDVALLADDERHCLAGNRAARRFLGVNRATLIVSHIDDYVPPARRGELDRAWAAFLTRKSMEAVFPILLPNGLERTVLLRGTADVRPGRHLITLRAVRRDQLAEHPAPDDSAASAELTFREREVLTWLARGASAPAIAEHISLSPETIRTHTRNAMRKLSAHSRPHAVALAIQQGQIDP
jgi:DNA-binding CsgD family transcriptional regulator/PAS domain-containing protein